MPGPQSAPAPIRVLLIDDHVVVRQGLRMLLENCADLTVVDEASGSQEALELATRERPDIVLLDLDLGRDNGLDAITKLVRLPGVRVLVLTGLQDSEVHRRAIRLGASGVVVKDRAGELLVKAIRRVYAGEVWVDRSTTAAIMNELRAGPTQDEHSQRIETLTSREREIVLLVAQGNGTAAIADRMHIAEKTVRNHLASIYDKLQVTGRLELALYAAKHGLGDSGEH